MGDIPCNILFIESGTSGGDSFVSLYHHLQSLKWEQFQERALIANYQMLGLYKNNCLVILSPTCGLSIIKDPYHDNIIQAAQPSNPLLKETMSYYQGADWIIKNRKNRMNP